MKKRILSIILVVSMMMSMLAMGASASDDEDCTDGHTWSDPEIEWWFSGDEGAALFTFTCSVCNGTVMIMMYYPDDSEDFVWNFIDPVPEVSCSITCETIQEATCTEGGEYF